jgi:FAD/FMN-containing dehydrogenase
MDQVLRVSGNDLDCSVEAGVTPKQLNDSIGDQSLFFPVDPAVDATLGGMAATRASGTNAVRHGTLRDNVLALLAVLASREAFPTGTRARKSSAGYDLTRLRVGCEGFPTDACVPISRLAECILDTRHGIDESGLVAPIVGHVGDGKFHVLFLVEPDAADAMKRVKYLNNRLMERTLTLHGTSTGEHGVGYGKLPYLEAEHGRPAIKAMRALKNALEPMGIMNPGKRVPLALIRHCTLRAKGAQGAQAK